MLPDWYRELSDFRHRDNRKAILQLANTLVPYFCLWYLTVRSVELGYPITVTLLLMVPAAALLVRVFILFHDCVHGSFFRSQRANTFFGHLLGLMVFTAFEDWRFSHLTHHASYANLDKRGYGDIWTMTLQEYTASSRLQRLLYRMYRSPLVLLGLGTIFIFLLRNRLPTRFTKRKQRWSVAVTNLLILAVFLAAARFIGWRTYLLIQLSVLWLAGVAGVWLFYVQHQFEGVHWARKGEWRPLRAAMEGCSFYKLPAVLRWITGNIGYHHVHHLSPRIPNYNLKRCYDAVAQLQAKAPLTFRESLACMRLKLWDERQQKLVGFP